MRDYLDQIEAASTTPGLYYVAFGASLTVPDIFAGLGAANGRTKGPRYVAWFDQNVAPLNVREPSADRDEMLAKTRPEIAAKLKLLWAHGPVITGAECYGLRCAFLHQGRATPDRSSPTTSSGRYSRIVFVEPGDPITDQWHNNLAGDVLQISVLAFIGDMLAGARAWLDSHEGTEPYDTNFRKSIKRYPNGAFVVAGVPIIG